MTSASVLLQGLTWGRNCSHNLATMRDEGILCDTTIIGSDNRKMRAHSCVLAAASPILKSLLGRHLGCKTIKSEISSHLWQMILKFVYTSEVLVPLDDIMSLKDIHNAAKALDIIGLRDAAREFISEDMLMMSEQELNSMQPGPMSPGFHSIVSLAFNKHPFEAATYQKTCYCRATQTRNDNREEVTDDEEIEEDDDEDVVEMKVPVICHHDLPSDDKEDNVRLSLNEDSQQATSTSQEEGSVSSSTEVTAAPTSADHLRVDTSSSSPAAAHLNQFQQQQKQAITIAPDVVPINVTPQVVSTAIENGGQAVNRPGSNITSSQDLQTVDASQLHIKKEDETCVGGTHTPADVLDAAMREIGDLSVSEDEQEEMPDGLDEDMHRRRSRVSRAPGCYRSTSPLDKSAPVYCPVCNKLLKNGAHSLNAHMTVHRKENPLKCDWCDFSTHKEGEYRKHKATHTGEKAFKCEQCKYSTNRPHDLKMHMKRHAGEKPYGCKACGKTFVKKSELKTHMMTHSGEKPHQCDYCEKSFRRRYDLSSHLLTHTDEKPYSCDICKNTFKRKKELEDHIACIHTEVMTDGTIDEPEPFHCSDCGFSAKSKRSLQAHVAASHSDTGFRCERCTKMFATKPMYLSHLKSHTGRPYECQHCGDDLETQLRLKAHLATDHGERVAKLVCSLCNKEYPNKNAFNTHMHKVHRKNPYMCHICGAIFKYAVNLRTHEMFHRGEKPHECPDCGKKFTQKLDLKRHKMVHTGEKPFVCAYCPFATTRKGYLKIHEMSHTGIKPHICSICNERFKIRSDLKIHMKKVHDIDIPMKVTRLQPKTLFKQESDEDDIEMDVEEYAYHEEIVEEQPIGNEVANNHDMGNVQLVEMPMEGVAQQVVYQEGDVPDAKTAETALQMAEEAAMQQYTVTLAAESLAELSQYVVTPDHLGQNL